MTDPAGDLCTVDLALEGLSRQRLQPEAFFNDLDYSLTRKQCLPHLVAVGCFNDVRQAAVAVIRAKLAQRRRGRQEDPLGPDLHDQVLDGFPALQAERSLQIELPSELLRQVERRVDDPSELVGRGICRRIERLQDEADDDRRERIKPAVATRFAVNDFHIRRAVGTDS